MIDLQRQNKLPKNKIKIMGMYLLKSAKNVTDTG